MEKQQCECQLCPPRQNVHILNKEPASKNGTHKKHPDGGVVPTIHLHHRDRRGHKSLTMYFLNFEFERVNGFWRETSFLAPRARPVGPFIWGKSPDMPDMPRTHRHMGRVCWWWGERPPGASGVVPGTL